MVIVFCEKCGKRVPEADMAAGSAVKTAESAWLCGVCAPRRVEKPPPPSRTTSAVPVLTSTARRSGAAPASTDSAAARDGGARRDSQSRAAPKTFSPLLIAAAAGGVCLVLGAVLLLSGPKSDNASATVAVGGTLSPAPQPEKPPSATSGTAAQSNAPRGGGDTGGDARGATNVPFVAGAGTPPPAPPVLSLAERAKQAEKDMDDMRGRRAANLLAEHKNWFGRNANNPWLYRNKLRELIGSYHSTPAAAEAEKLLAELKSLPGQRGRYVRIENLGQKRILSLAEVQVFSDGKNVAPPGKAGQSSVACGGDPHRAIDGNTNGVYNNGSVTHTVEQENPWWEVDLGAEKELEALVLWNRTEACMERLKNFRVSVLDANRKTVWETTVADIPSPNVTLSLSAK